MAHGLRNPNENPLLRNKEIFMQAAPEFKKIFGMNLFNYWCVYTGFDVIKFDDAIQTPDGKSTSAFLKEKWGDEAEQFIRNLIQKR